MNVSYEAVNAAIADYTRQSQEIDQELQRLDEQYRQQRELGLNTLYQLRGAVRALELLLPKESPDESITLPTE